MASLTWTDHNGSGTDSATYSPTVNIGAGGAGRTIFGIVMSRNAGAFSSVTFDGVSASTVGTPQSATDTGTNRIAMVKARASDLPDPAASSLSMGITWASAAARCYWLVAVTADDINQTPFAIATPAIQTPNGSAAAFDLDLPLDVPQGGFTIVGAVGAANGAPTGALFTSMANVTATFNGGLSGEAISYLAAGDNDLDAESARAIKLTAQNAAGIFGLIGIAASFAPAAAGRPTSKRHGGVPFMALPGRGNVW